MNVKEVQRRLWEQSRMHKQHRESGSPLFPVNSYDGRVRNLMDLLHHPQWIAEACARVMTRSRGKAPGVDGITVSVFERTLTKELEALRLELKHGTYRPQPLRRSVIIKPNGKPRKLGIPCLRDKIVQETVRMAIEPIFEVEFHDDSYGFRPNRSTHHAIFRCKHLMNRQFTWVIEGDVKACFDEISHKAILQALREKVMDNKFLNLIRLFLKSGVEIEGIVHPTEKGVPQGGVVSPLLANVVLNKLDWFLHAKGSHNLASRRAWYNREPNLRFVRYADDWCVFITRASKRYAENLREEIREFLVVNCGLRLSEEKTHITHVREGFEFLSFRLEMGVVRRGHHAAKIKVPLEAVANAKRSLAKAIRHRPQQESIAVRMIRGSAVVRGWAHYYKIAHNYSVVSSLLDHHAYWIAVKTICRKQDISTAKCLRGYTFGSYIGMFSTCTLAKFRDIRMAWDQGGPEPYVPGNGDYESDSEVDGDRYIHEKNRPGGMDLKHQALARDGMICSQCGKPITAATSQADHIKPVESFASFVQASYLENMQTLCLSCHKEKTYAK